MRATGRRRNQRGRCSTRTSRTSADPNAAGDAQMPWKMRSGRGGRGVGAVPDRPGDDRRADRRRSCSRGDLTTRSDAPIKQGDPLMEIEEPGKPLNAEIAVPERDIQMIRRMPATPEQQTQLEKATSGLGGQAGDERPADERHRLQDRADRPAGRRQGSEQHVQGVRRCWTDASREWTRPGMEGEARIDLANDAWSWIWTHRLVDWLRLKVWM